MTLTAARIIASDIQHLKARIAAKEANLRISVAKFMEDKATGKVREVARTLCVSPAYICDLKHCRRPISAAMLKRLGRLG